MSEFMIPPPHRPTAVKPKTAKAIVIAAGLLAGVIGLAVFFVFVTRLPGPVEPEVQKDPIWVVWSVKHNYGRLDWLKSQTVFADQWECQSHAKDLSKNGTLSECRNELIRH
jgi:hypothetical protein